MPTYWVLFFFHAFSISQSGGQKINLRYELKIRFQKHAVVYKCMHNHLRNHWDFLHKSEQVNRNMAWIKIEKTVTYRSLPAVLVVCWSMPVFLEVHNLLPPPLQMERDEGEGWLLGSSSPWEGGRYCSHSQTPTEAAHSTYRVRQQH